MALSRSSSRHELLIARCAQQREQLARHWQVLTNQARRADDVTAFIHRFAARLPRVVFKVLLWMLRRR